MALLSQTTEYALQAIVLLAAFPGEPRTSKQITAATSAPEGYISKVMQTLVRAGLVHSKRGLGGGFTLARHANDITLLDVVDAVDPLVPIERCPMGQTRENCRQLCALHRRINHSTEMVRRVFRDTTISELLVNPPHWLDADAPGLQRTPRAASDGR